MAPAACRTTEEQPSGHAAGGFRRSEPGPSGTGVTLLLSTIRGHVNREARASSANHGHRALRVRRRPARVRVPQGHHGRGHHRLGGDLRLAHVRVADDGAPGHGPAARRRGPAAHRADERDDLVRRPAGRAGAHEGPRGDRPGAVRHQGEMAGRARLRAARRPVPRPDPAVLVALRDVPGGLARGRRPDRDLHLRGVGGRRPRRRRAGLQGPQDEPHPRGRAGRQGPAAALPRRCHRQPDDRRRRDLDRDAARRGRAVDRHRRRRPVRLPDGRHRPARAGARASSTCTGWRSRASTPTRCSRPASRRPPACATARASSGASSSGRSSGTT